MSLSFLLTTLYLVHISLKEDLRAGVSFNVGVHMVLIVLSLNCLLSFQPYKTVPLESGAHKVCNNNE